MVVTTDRDSTVGRESCYEHTRLDGGSLSLFSPLVTFLSKFHFERLHRRVSQSFDAHEIPSGFHWPAGGLRTPSLAARAMPGTKSNLIPPVYPTFFILAFATSPLIESPSNDRRTTRADVHTRESVNDTSAWHDC